jgi:hypothetical protein
MTVAISIVTSDGIVVATDSRTTWGVGGGQSRVLSDFTHKVVKVNNFAIATYGWAFLLKRNIAGHLANFTRSTADGVTLQELADRLAEYMGTRFGSCQAL